MKFRRILLPLALTIGFPLFGVDYVPNTCRAITSDTDSVSGSQPPDPYSSPGLLCSTDDLPCLPIARTIYIARVAGPGINSSGATDNINGDGTLVNPDAYVANGVVSKYAYLSVSYSYALIHTTQLVVLFNGQPVQPGDSQSLTLLGLEEFPSDPSAGVGSGRVCLKVPIGLVRFPQRSIGGQPTPAQNQVTITSSNPKAVSDCDDCSLQASTGSLSFEALAPVILVHGWVSGPWWWGPAQNSGFNLDDYCGADRDPVTNALVTTEVDFNFVSVLKTARVPFECKRIKIEKNASIEAGGNTLQGRNPTTDSPGIRNILNEFGAKHAHIVGHSKGGLWTRSFLPLANTGDPNTEVAVYSVTTLETPHQGSYLADVVVYSHRYWVSTFGLPVTNWRFVLGFLKKNRRGAVDMTVAAMVGFNTTNQLPSAYFADGVKNPVSYRYVASDADVNNDGNVTGGNASPCTQTNNAPPCNEIYPYVPEWEFPHVYHDLGTHQFVTFPRTGRLGHLIPQIPNLNPSAVLIPNDFAVQVLDAFHPSFASIPGPTGQSFAGVPYWKHNHKTAGFTDVAQAVLQAIQKAQPTVPPQQ